MRVPNTVRNVADVIGMEAAVRLAGAAYSNRQVYVPAGNVGPEHRLLRVLNHSEVRTLQNHFGGVLLPFPTLRRAKRQRIAERKADAIQSDIAKGMSTAEIAAKHRVSGQYVRRIRTKGSTSSGWQRPRKNER